MVTIPELPAGGLTRGLGDGVGSRKPGILNLLFVGFRCKVNSYCLLDTHSLAYRLSKLECKIQFLMFLLQHTL